MRINSLHDALAFFPDIDGYWMPHDLPGTEAKILALLAPNWITESDPKSVITMTQLARAQALQGKFAEARTALDHAQTIIAEASPELDPTAEVRWLLEQGRVHCLAMKLAKAQEFFTKAWDRATAEKRDFFAIDAALMLSTIRPPKFQNEWLRKALDLANRTEAERARLWLAQLLMLEGWHSYDFRQFEGALESFDRALAQPLIQENEANGFALQWSRARTLRAMERVDEAFAMQQELLTKMKAIGRVSGHVYLELAELKQALGLTEEAKGFFELAYADLSADGWYSDNRIDELERMKYLYKKR